MAVHKQRDVSVIASDTRSLKQLFATYNDLAQRAQPHSFQPCTQQEAQWRGILREDVLMARNDLLRRYLNPKLPEPYPASPTRPPTHIINISRRGDFKGSVPFAATYAASVFLTTCIADSGYKWRSKTSILLIESGYDLSSDTLEDILEHKLTVEEQEWQLTDPYYSWAQEIATGVKSPHPLPVSPRTERSERAPHAPNAPRPDGLISLASLCTELKLDPREARAMLRRKMNKPAHGWNFTQDEVNNVKKIISQR